MHARFPLVLPFALLASLVAGCSSSSGGETTNDAGSKDTGITPNHDSGTDTGKTDTGVTKPDASKDTGSGDTSTPTGDGGIVITPAAGSTLLVPGLVSVIGITDDDELIYYDSTGGISAVDAMKNITVIAPGPTVDGGIPPAVTSLGGDIVAVLTDYKTTTVSGNAIPSLGTLSIWSKTKTASKLVQVATNSTGLINLATDSSYIAFTDSADAAGENGNVGVAAGDGTGAADIAKGVKVNILTATTCNPFVSFDGKYAVASTCANLDGGNGIPSISSYDSTNSWAPVLLTATGGPNAPFTSADINFAVDTLGDNVLTVTPAAGTVLSVQPIAGGTATQLTANFGSITGGVPYLYLAPDSTYALFTNADGSFGRSTFATPTSAPVTNLALAAAGSVAGVYYTSADGKYQIDYSTPVATGALGPASLNLRNTTTGTATALIPANSGLASSFPGGFTADSSYAIFTTALKTVGTDASSGTLKVAAVADGTISTLVSNTTVWDAIALTGTKILYNQNYTLDATFPNAPASGDMYIADATSATQGTLLVKGADAPNGFYLSHDKSTLFYTFTQLSLPDGGTTGTAVNGDGLYVVTLP